MNDKMITLKITEGELALLEMAMLDLRRINNESARNAGRPRDPRIRAARNRVEKATETLLRKIETANVHHEVVADIHKRR